MKILRHLLLMLKDKVHIFNGDQDPVLAETPAGFLSQVHTSLLCTVHDHLKAAGVDELLNVLEAVNVASCTHFDLNIAVDIFDCMNIFIMLVVVDREIKDNNLVNTAVIVETRQVQHVAHRLKIINAPDCLTVFQIDGCNYIFLFHTAWILSIDFPLWKGHRKFSGRMRPPRPEPLQMP